MKKTILAVLALASVVACNKSEVLEVAPQKAISFGNPFVENATKAIDPSLTATSENFNTFKVYGKVTTNAGGSTNIFNGVDVYKTEQAETDIASTGSWYYSASYVQYWLANATYDFAAVTNGTVATADDNSMPATISYSADGITDLLYATKQVAVTQENFESVTGTVNFDFNHLLSKVVFKFTNEYPEVANIDIMVSDIKITNPKSTGTYAVATDKWTTTEATIENGLSFGNAIAADSKVVDAEAIYFAYNESAVSNYEKLLIPGSINGLNITFTANIYLKQTDKYTLVDTKNYSLTVKDETNTTPLIAGNAYCFNVGITDELKPITFGVASVGAWKPVADDGTTTTPVEVEIN
ncbi:MAG: fimbrillin family protein [Bacteroidales bacterium]|nr:fimbrillin family protein [Bacteroidales bacterium]